MLPTVRNKGGFGKKIRSAAMEATAADSLSDTAATAAVLLAMLIAKWTGLDIDGWVGLVVAGFILFSGVKSARETISPLLGQPPEKEFVDRIQAIVLSHPEILGLHDLVVHDYGPGRVMVSLHAEVPAHGDLLELHDVVDNIEMDLSRQLNCQAVIHMDPVVTDDGLTGPLRSRVAELVKQVDPAITIHDFRVVAGPTHTNLVFDAVVPFDEKLTAAQAADELLNVSGVDASIVVAPDGKGGVFASARSIGELNVQLIMEKLGGGGNSTTAGGQVADASVDEVRARLLNAIDEYMEE